MNINQLQTILDKYSVGKIASCYDLNSVSLQHDAQEITLERKLVETNRGTYMVVFSPNDELHNLWWSSDTQEYPSKLSTALKLNNAKLLLTNENTQTVHKFDLRISIFAL